MNRIAPEIAQKIAVLLQNRDVDARPGQQKAKHHARRSAARDTACCPVLLCHGRPPIIAAACSQ
jgi:hypothetical protein